MNKKEELLKQVWETCTFDEIIDAGFEYNKCSAIDLKSAANEFSEPIEDIITYIKENITNMDEFLDELFSETNISLKNLLDKYSTTDILDCLDIYDIIDYAEDTYTLRDKYQNEYIRGHDDGYEEASEEYIKNYKTSAEEIRNMSIDNKWSLFADIFGTPTYESEKFIEEFKNFINELNKSTYKNHNKKIKLLNE